MPTRETNHDLVYDVERVKLSATAESTSNFDSGEVVTTVVAVGVPTRVFDWTES